MFSHKTKFKNKHLFYKASVFIAQLNFYPFNAKNSPRNPLFMPPDPSPIAAKHKLPIQRSLD